MYPYIKTANTILTVLILFFATACTCTRPALQYKPAQYLPELIDTGDRKLLIQASEKQLQRLTRIPVDTTVQFGSDSYNVGWLHHSLVHFIDLLKTKSPSELDHILRRDFNFYQATGLSNSSNREVLFTGYFEPVFLGSLHHEYPFIYPLYGVPDDLIVDRSGEKPKIGRIKQDTLLSYWSRKQIDLENRCAGFEVAYLKDPVDAFVLHVQGSGKIRLPNNSLRSLHFAGSNGLQYKSIGKLLVDSGKMQLADVNMESIRDYLNRHPEEREAILHHNPRFIFFKLLESKPPKGSGGVALTPERSIAIDPATLPWQAPAFIATERPTFNNQGELDSYTPFNRFMMAQDTGSAIKGSGRVDIFWGNGLDAEKTASHLKEKGHLYFLVKKRAP